MKSNITLSIDTEIVEKLKRETNYSDLVNEQMKAYYDIKCIDNIQVLKENQAKTKQIIKENRKKLREIELKMQKIKEKEKIILEKVQSRAKLITRIKEKRALIAEQDYKRVEFLITPEEEADRILKGGSQIT